MAKRAARLSTIRTTVLSIRVLPDQREAIELAAHRAGVTVSAFASAALSAAMADRQLSARAAFVATGAAGDIANDRPHMEGAPQSGDDAHSPLHLRVPPPPMPNTVFERRWQPAPGAPPSYPVRTISLSDPAALYDLRRIGQNINQIAHAVNTGLPPSVELVVDSFRHLFEALTDAPEFLRRLEAIRLELEFNGAAAPSARV